MIKPKNKKLTISIYENIYNDFEKYCKELKVKKSEAIEYLIMMFLFKKYLGEKNDKSKK